MKGLKKMALLLLLLTLGITLVSCLRARNLKNDHVTYTVNWGGEEGEITYTGLAHHKDYGWITSRDFYTLDGIYALPGGRGSKIFDTAGNLVKGSEVDSGETYYAFWKPISVVLCFDLPSGSTFEDGTDRKEMLVDYTGTLPAVFPKATDEYGVEHVRWHLDMVNGERVSQKLVTDTYGNLLEGLETVANYCTVEPTRNEPYVITFSPYTEYETVTGDKTVTLTFDFGGGVASEFLLEVYSDIDPSCFWYGEHADRELVGWTRHPTECSEFVTEIDNISENITLYAVWKNYRTIRLHLHNNRVKSLRVYQGEPILLDEAIALVGTAFENWYEDGDFNTVASRIVTYEGTVSDYYAKFTPKSTLDEGSHRLTLTYAYGQDEVFEIKLGQDIKNCLWYGTEGGRELTEWRGSGDDPVRGGTLTADTALGAVWKLYKGIRIHMYDGLVKTMRLYEGESYRLRSLPDREGDEFDDWYLDPDFRDRAPSTITFSDAQSDYYAAYEVTEKRG